MKLRNIFKSIAILLPLELLVPLCIQPSLLDPSHFLAFHLAHRVLNGV